MLSKRLLFVPVIRDVHRCLAVVDLKLQQFSYYNSWSYKDDACLQWPRDYILKKLSLHTAIEWLFVYHNSVMWSFCMYVC